MKEVGFAFLCSKKSCLEDILSFGKEDTKNTIGNNRNKLSRFILEKGTKGSYSKTISFDFQCLLPFLFLVELLFLSVSFSIATPLLEWNNDTSYPLAVYAPVALVGQDDCIYVFRGFNSSGDAVSNSYKYNTTAGSPKEWIEIASMKTAVGGAAGCVGNDGKFFIFGGAQLNSGFSPNFIQIYNATDNSWTNITASGPSIEDFFMSCALDSSTGLMYITGGYSNGIRFYSYNVSSNNIINLSTSSSPSPFNLDGQGSFVANNNKLYIFGGYDKDTNNYSAFTYIYDIAKSSWSNGTNMTQAAANSGYATDGSRFYVIGGTNNDIYLNYTQVFDISSGIWSVNDGIVYPGGIARNAAVFLDGSLHSIGGYSNDTYMNVHRIASLCGVYNFSGQCDDENQCTFNDTCHGNGTCSGTSICTPNQCQNATCNSTIGICVYSNVSGIGCNDNNNCTTNDTCSNGTCTGAYITCPPNECQRGLCDTNVGCVLANLPEGTPCNSSNKYLVNATCTNGICGSTTSSPFISSATSYSSISPLFSAFVFIYGIVFIVLYRREV